MNYLEEFKKEYYLLGHKAMRANRRFRGAEFFVSPPAVTLVSSSDYSSAPKIKAKCSSETSVGF
jgi:hypothetical protein